MLGLLRWLHELFSRKPIKLVIVRRYQDANGAYVGELYISGRMVGASLDTLPLDFSEGKTAWHLDTSHDFLAQIRPATVRVGAFEPRDNRSVQRQLGRLSRWRLRLETQNRFMLQIKSLKHV